MPLSSIVERLRRSQAEGPAGPFRVLLLCTGNLCRSRIAESLLAHRLGAVVDAGSLIVESAGTRPASGVSQPGAVREEIERLGGAIDDAPPRGLDDVVLAQVDLVLTMTRGQRTAAVRRAPRLVRRAFTLPEYAHLVASLAERPPAQWHPGGGDAEVLRRMTEAAARRRGAVAPSPDAAAIEIADPFGGERPGYRDAADRIDGEVALLAETFVKLRGRNTGRTVR
ncbi:arsenate reductase/protein-tyrosine-phosphatase family protein [Microbacterium gilvum]|uniref:Low molecular weight phosphatase family protein n=1 Tax=Microbacterium gilvum TaxID=1336204 RepID=A0ABP9A9Q5_9MICO